MKTLIIGLGNPILGDDGVGWKIAEKIREQLSVFSDQSVVVECASLGGLSLMERMVGFERAILIDAMESGQGPVGSVRVFPLEALHDAFAGHSASAHDTSLLTALHAARQMGMPIPDLVMVIAIEARNVYDFSEELSPPVALAIHPACQAVLDLLEKEAV
jgi:hydrogenase maturation protease